MKYIFAFCSIFGIFGCTVSVNVIRTEGTATDLIDEVQSPTNKTDANVQIPIKPL